MKLPSRVKDLTGLQFSQLTVQEFKQLGKGGAIWSCMCSCGKSTEVCSKDLSSGNTKSCGCRRIEVTKRRSTKHGQAANKHHTEYTKEYKTWRSILNRCYTQSSKAYQNYGGRGIRVCDRWRNSFASFKEDMGEAPPGYTIERLDVDAGYSPENCIWAPSEDQCKNKRNTVHVMLNGVKMIQAEAARELQMHPSVLCDWHKGRSKMPDDIKLVFLN